MSFASLHTMHSLLTVLLEYIDLFVLKNLILDNCSENVMKINNSLHYA